MSGDTRFGLGTVPCNQRDPESFSLQVQQDTTILWGLPIYLCIPNIYLPMYLASQLASYRFVYLSTCLFAANLIISNICVHIHIYTYLCIYSYVFAEVDMPEFEAISFKELSYATESVSVCFSFVGWRILPPKNWFITHLQMGQLTYRTYLQGYQPLLVPLISRLCGAAVIHICTCIYIYI